MSNNKQEMLENILIKGTLTRNVLYASTSRESYVQKTRVVKGLLADNLIKAKSVKRMQRTRQQTTDHYLITPAGVRSLREDALKDAELMKRPYYDERKVGTRYPWLRYINVASTKGMWRTRVSRA